MRPILALLPLTLLGASWTATSPIELCTDLPAGATAIEWYLQDGTLLGVTSEPRFEITCDLTSNPIEVYAVAREGSTRSDPGPLSDPIYCFGPWGADLSGDGLTGSGDVAFGWIPAFAAGTKSCAPVDGVSQCAPCP